MEKVGTVRFFPIFVRQQADGDEPYYRHPDKEHQKWGGVTNQELELEFRRLCDGSNKLGIRLPFDVIFVDKKANSAGLQLADLVARPVGMSVLRPEQANRAFDVLKCKFFCCGGREQVGIGFENWGLKIHPAPKSEKPR